MVRYPKPPSTTKSYTRISYRFEETIPVALDEPETQTLELVRLGGGSDSTTSDDIDNVQGKQLDGDRDYTVGRKWPR